MFELKVSSLHEAIDLSQQWATHVISILDPDLDSGLISIPVAGPKVSLNRYYFHDITPNRLMSWSAIPATTEQIQSMLEFTASLQSTDKLLVHCYAGISRSTAVAIGVLCQHGLTPNEAVKYLLSIRPQAFPNQHVLALFDEILALDGQLVTAGIEEIDKFYWTDLLSSQMKSLQL